MYRRPWPLLPFTGGEPAPVGPALGRGSGVCPEVGGRAEGRRGSQSPGGARKRGTHVMGRKWGLGRRADNRAASLSWCARTSCSCTHTCTHARTHACTHVRAHTCVHTETCTQRHMHTHRHTRTHAHTCTHMCTDTHTRTSSSQGPGRAALLSPPNR